VDEIDPEGRRRYKKAYYSFESVVPKNKKPEPEKNFIGPIRSGSATKSYPEEKGDNEKYMEYNNK